MRVAWEGEIQDALSTLPEFEDTDLDDPWYWAIEIGADWVPDAEPGEFGGRFIQGVRALKGGDQTIKEVTRRVPLGMVLNITMIVAAADVDLTRRLRERQK